MSPRYQWKVAEGLWKSHAEQSAAARYLLCDLLGNEVIVEHDAKGAPHLPSRPDLHISISHCRTAVAVAVSNIMDIGIDIESRRHVNESLITRVCTPEEMTAIRHSDDIEMAFLQLWTRKEAVLKCRKTGIRGFDSIVQALHSDDIEVTDLPCGLPDTVAALAIVKGE